MSPNESKSHEANALTSTNLIGGDSSNLIGGEWTRGEGGSRDVVAPQTGEKIGAITYASQVQIDRAIAAAAKAQPAWATTPPKERAKVLYRFREILARDLEKIVVVKASESGKVPDEARAGLLKGLEVLEYALSIQNLDLGGKIEVSRGVTCEYRREPLGVVANIAPFNFPGMVPMWTLPIALALGNAYVWKPSEKVPLTSLLIGESLQEAGLPPGLLTILQGEAEQVNAIIDHREIRAIGFVGSTKIARAVYLRGTALGKRVLALGGAKNHVILLPDADPELSGPGISDSFTGCAGQRCMAASVLLAVGLGDSQIERHVERIVARAKSLVLGGDMGAIITPEQVTFLRGAIDRAERDGAKILLDGRLAKPPVGKERGNWIGPTILDGVKAGSEAATVELFGPILAIVRCRDLSEALGIERASEYGNACSVFTTSGALAERVAREATAGMIGVNVGVPVPREPFSFGGIGLSKFGQGDITGAHSLDLWSNVRKVTSKWQVQKDSTWMS